MTPSSEALSNPKLWKESWERIQTTAIAAQDRVVLTRDRHSSLNSNASGARLICSVRALPRLSGVKTALQRLHASQKQCCFSLRGLDSPLPLNSTRKNESKKALSLNPTIWRVGSSGDSDITVIDAVSGAVLMCIQEPKKNVIVASLLHAPFRGFIDRKLRVLPIEHLSDFFSIRESSLINTDYVWVGFTDGAIRLFPADPQRVREQDRSVLLAKGDIADIVFELPKHHTSSVVAITRSPCHDIDMTTNLVSTSRLGNCIRELTAATSCRSRENREHLSLVCTASEDSCVVVWDLKAIYRRLEEMRASSNRAKDKFVSSSNAPRLMLRGDIVTFNLKSAANVHECVVRSTCTLIKVRPLLKLKGGVGGFRTLNWITTEVTTANYQKSRDVVAMTRDPKESTAPAFMKSRRTFQSTTRWEKREEDRTMLQLSEQNMREVEAELECLMPPLAPEPVQCKRINLIVAGDIQGVLHMWDLDEELGKKTPEMEMETATSCASSPFFGSRYTNSLLNGVHYNMTPHRNYQVSHCTTTPQTAPGSLPSVSLTDTPRRGPPKSFYLPPSSHQTLERRRAVPYGFDYINEEVRSVFCSSASTRSTRKFGGMQTITPLPRSYASSRTNRKVAPRRPHSVQSARGSPFFLKSPLTESTLFSSLRRGEGGKGRGGGFGSAVGIPSNGPGVKADHAVRRRKKKIDKSPHAGRLFDLSARTPKGCRTETNTSRAQALGDETKSTSASTTNTRRGLSKRSSARCKTKGRNKSTAIGGDDDKSDSNNNKTNNNNRAASCVACQYASECVHAGEVNPGVKKRGRRTLGSTRKTWKVGWSPGNSPILASSLSSVHRSGSLTCTPSHSPTYSPSCSPSRAGYSSYGGRAFAEWILNHRDTNDMFNRKAKCCVNFENGGTITAIAVDIPPVIRVTMRCLPDPPEPHYSLLEKPTEEETRQRRLANTFHLLTDERAFFFVFERLQFYVSSGKKVMNIRSFPKAQMEDAENEFYSTYAYEGNVIAHRVPFKFDIVFKRCVVERLPHPVVLLFMDNPRHQLWVARSDGSLSVISTETKSVITRVTHSLSEKASGTPQLSEKKALKSERSPIKRRPFSSEEHEACERDSVGYFLDFAPISLFQQFDLLQIFSLPEFDSTNNSFDSVTPTGEVHIAFVDDKEALDEHTKSHVAKLGRLLETLKTCHRHAVSVRVAQRDYYYFLLNRAANNICGLVNQCVSWDASHLVRGVFWTWSHRREYCPRDDVLRQLRQKRLEQLSRVAGALALARMTQQRRACFSRWIEVAFWRQSERRARQVKRVLYSPADFAVQRNVAGFLADHARRRLYWSIWKSTVSSPERLLSMTRRFHDGRFVNGNGTTQLVSPSVPPLRLPTF